MKETKTECSCVQLALVFNYSTISWNLLICPLTNARPLSSLFPAREFPTEISRSCWLWHLARPDGEQECPTRICLQHHVHRRDGFGQIHANGHPVQHQFWIAAFSAFPTECEPEVKHLWIGGEQRKTEGNHTEGLLYYTEIKMHI